MPAFDYSGYDRVGKLQKGVIVADSQRHARRLLKEKQLIPSTVSEVKKTSSKGKLGWWGETRVNTFDLALLLQQLAILIQSGLALEESLRVTIEQAETDRQRRMVQSWRSEITEGRSFSDALNRSPYKIPESVIAAVGVGEESGHLHEILKRLAEDIETSTENRKTLARALIYPSALLVTSLIVVVIMMIWVVPKITIIFASSGQELPLVTRVVMGMSHFTTNYAIYIFVIMLPVFFGLRQFLQDIDRKRRWHKNLLSIPGLGRWIYMANIADWARSLGVLLASGVPALVALKISSGVVENVYLRSKLESVTEAMRQGSSLHKALSSNLPGSGFLVQMVASGEVSSELDKMLLRVSDYYALRLQNAVDVFMKLINPILIVFMGLVILSVVASVMLPIMDMNNMI